MAGKKNTLQKLNIYVESNKLDKFINYANKNKITYNTTTKFDRKVLSNLYSFKDNIHYRIVKYYNKRINHKNHQENPKNQKINPKNHQEHLKNHKNIVLS